jgi:L-ornithine Nalpha-acyltransferase
MLMMVQPETDIMEEWGDLRLRLARSSLEVKKAQSLRYRVFYEELNAKATNAAHNNGLDSDAFDDICDHLMVVRSVKPFSADPIMLEDGELVGTYRLLRQEVANRHGGFYSAQEFDIGPLLERKSHLSFLELGRSCVLQEYRTKPVVELLWQGIWNYVRAHRLDVMFGCASLAGTDLDAHRHTLSFLAQNAKAPAEWNVRAVSSRYVEMNASPMAVLDPKQSLRALPPLVKGYLRLGCFIGEGAVVDHQFDTIDILIVLPVSVINPRYFSHFGQPAQSAGDQLRSK